MSVWLCIPSKRPPDDPVNTLSLWRERGYKIALFLDVATIMTVEEARQHIATHCCDYAILSNDPYPGYGEAVNRLVRRVMLKDPSAEWFVIGGDDVEPDAVHSAEEIARGCCDHFGGTFGVMQPTGDRWGANEPWARRMYPDRPAYIDRICGSAWYGREYCRRINQGNGPLWPEYRHMFVDEEAQCVAEKYGVFWQRRDLIQLHRQWGRKPGATQADIPTFLREVNSEEHWKQARELFKRRKAAGFPGSEPLA